MNRITGCSLIAAVLLGHAPAASAGAPEAGRRGGHASAGVAVLYVDQSAPEGGDGVSWATAFRDLQDALAFAADVRQVHIAEGVYTPDRGTGDTAVSFDLTGARGLELFGGYPAGGAPSPERDPAAHRVVLSGDLRDDDVVTIDVDGRVGFLNMTDNSSRVLDISGAGGDVLIDGLVVRGGRSSGNGAGILALNSLARLSGVTVEECWATGSGGGMYIESDIVRSPVLIGCAFVRCAAERGGGLAVDVVDLVLDSCAFRQNSAEEDGGAFHATTASFKAIRNRLVDSEFTANTALDGSGGGCFADGGIEFDLETCRFTDNRAGGAGGAGYFGRLGVVDRCRFEGNEAFAFGGALAYPGEVRASHFSANNSLEGCGGAIYFPLRVSGGQFEGNTALGGGAVCGGDEIVGGEFLANAAAESGGAISAAGRVLNSLFRANTARDGGAIAGTDRVTNCRIIGNSAQESGGGVYAIANLIDSTLRDNDAGTHGGGASADAGTTVRAEGCVFEFNTATNGGAWTANRGEVLRSRFIGNAAREDGGAVWSGAPASPSAPPRIVSSLFVGNTAAFRGGAMWEPAYDVLNCTIIGNAAQSAAGLGGAVPLRIRNTVLWSNLAPGLPVEQQQLAGAFHDVTNSMIEGLAAYFGDGNLRDAPAFLDRLGADQIPFTGDEDYSLTSESPGIDGGDESLALGTALNRSDLLGRPRIASFGGWGEATIDIGAFEAQDCDADGVVDREAVLLGLAEDCNNDLRPDSCQLTGPGFAVRSDMLVSESIFFQSASARVTADGRFAAAGGLQNPSTTNGESVAVLANDGDGWVYEARIDPQQEGDTNLGRYADFGGETLVLSVEQVSGTPFLTGALYIAERDGGAWNVTRRITPPAGAEGVYLGNPRIDGDRLVVAPYSLGSNTVQQVLTWTRENGEWEYSGAFGAGDWPAQSEFGHTLEFESGRVFVGAPGQTNPSRLQPGFVAIYEQQGAGWVLAQKIDSPVSDTAWFGYHIGAHGDYLVVGAPNEPRGPGLGVAVLYQRSGDSWDYVRTLVPPEDDTSVSFGWRVGIDDQRIVVSSSQGRRLYLYSTTDPDNAQVLEMPENNSVNHRVDYSNGLLGVLVQGPADWNPESRRLLLFESLLEDADGNGVPDACESPCSPADLAAPLGLLDLSDITAFVAAFTGGGPQADLAEPFGVLDLADLTEFVGLFTGGCP